MKTSYMLHDQLRLGPLLRARECGCTRVRRDSDGVGNVLSMRMRGLEFHPSNPQKTKQTNKQLNRHELGRLRQEEHGCFLATQPSLICEHLGPIKRTRLTKHNG